MPTVQIAGHDVLLDDEDLYLAREKEWTVRKSGSTHYVQRKLTEGAVYQGYESLHRLIMCCQPGMVVDHVNGNGLDNRRCNLRVCSHSENMQNRKRHQNNSSGFKGVYFDSTPGARPWRAQITAAGRKYNLGRFDTADGAYEAYVKAARRLHGDFARVA